MVKPIVLVEDNPQDLELALSALAKARLANEVVVLRDGEDALEYLCYQGRHEFREKGNPALILLDLQLPKVDGLEILAHLKKDPGLRMVPVVMLTGSREEEILARSYELGVNAYVVKPVHFHDFVKAVQDLGDFWAVLNEPPPGTIRVRGEL